MKRIIIISIAICIAFCFLTGCSKEDALNSDIVELEKRISMLELEISNLEMQKRSLMEENKNVKIENDLAKYIVTFNIKQNHFTLDLGQHLKDEFNDISIQIPVDKEYFDSVNVGDTIADDFRMGSLIFKGSFGNWKVTVQAKEIL